jgi:hypothetical protein
MIRHHPVLATLSRALGSLGVVLAIAAPGATQEGFAVLGDEGVWLQINSRVTGGDVGVNRDADAPFLAEDSELTVGPGVQLGGLVIGDRIALGIGSQVNDVHANEVVGIGLATGSLTMPLSFPVVASLPDVPDVVPGRDDVSVPLFSAATLDPGGYADLDVGVAATLTLTAGVYEFANATLGNSARLHCDGPVEVRIGGRLLVDHLARVEPAPDVEGLSADDLVLVVTGENGGDGALDELPFAASLGQGTRTRALVSVPNGTLEVQQNSDVVGSLLGRGVIVGPGVGVAFEDGFGLELVAGGAKLSLGVQTR